MPRLLSRVPFPDRPDEVVVRGERVRIRANQIIAWVSLSLPRIVEQHPAAVPFPAILDTGYGHSFALTERQLAERAGLRADALRSPGAIRDRGRRVPLRLVNLWLHPNARGSREPATDQMPYPLVASLGIAVYPGGDFPRLPLLGLRAIAENGLVLRVHGSRREAALRTRRWWWPFD